MKLAALAAALVCAGCSTAPLEVSRVVSPSDASRAQGTKLRAVAVLRGEGRAELPANAIVEPARVRVPQPGMFDYALDPGEKILRDDKGVITGVETPGDPPTVTAFKPGTAVLDEEHNVVRGELELGEQRMPLLPTDRIEVRGSFVSGEEIPLGGRVESTRAVSALAFGLALFTVSYVPAVYSAATSPHSYDTGMFIPIFGPWVALAARPSCVDAVGVVCAGSSLEKFLVAFDGVGQAVGILIFLVGLPTRTEVKWPESTETKTGLRVRPTLGFGRLGLSGEF